MFASLTGGSAFAQDSDALDGEASVTVVEPLALEAVEDLRFGAILQPVAAGTITIGSDSSATATGGVSLIDSDALFSSPRGAAQFIVRGEDNRFFLFRLPNKIDITSGANTMEVDRFATDANQQRRRLDADGEVTVDVGGRLNVDANQPTGNYSGTFEISVLYL